MYYTFGRQAQKKAPKKHISSVLFIAQSFGYLTKNH